jgi:hypothetical protein
MICVHFSTSYYVTKITVPLHSPFQVTWSVRPQVAKVSISSIKTWLQGNTFDEDHAHGVRNLIINPDLLSAIK